MLKRRGQKNSGYKKNLMTPSWANYDEKILHIFENLDRDLEILEIGCGSGYFLKKLYSMGFKNLNFCDISNFLAYNELIKLNKLKIVDLNYDPLPYPNESMDVVYAFQVIEHLENGFHIFREVHRVLRDNGLFIFSIPNLFNIFNRILFLLTGNLYPYPLGNNHIMVYTKNTFKKAYSKYFQIVNIIYSKNIEFAPRLLFFLPRSEVFSKKVAYVCKKI